MASFSPRSIDHKTVGVPSDIVGQIIGSRGDAADAPRQKGGKEIEWPHIVVMLRSRLGRVSVVTRMSAVSHQ